jgi:hypothetical protein
MNSANETLQPLVFEDGTVLQVYPSLDEAFTPLPSDGHPTTTNLQKPHEEATQETH